MALHNIDEQKKKAEALRQKHKEEYQRTRTALRAVASDPNFQIVMRHMAKICGFFQSSVVLDPNHHVCTESTIFNEGRRAVYLDFRRMMTDDVRRLIESKGEEHGPESESEPKS